MRHWTALFTAFIVLSIMGCKQPQVRPDVPRLTPAVRMQDITFRSAALARDMRYRVILPKDVAADKRLPVVYLLHGGGGDYRDWSNYSNIAQYAEKGIILVMPQGDSSYYTNAASRPQDCYEDYIVNDLIADVEMRFPALPGRSHRAIAGESMGGFGAVKIALRRPDLFIFAVGISSALDVPTRPFSIKRIGQWRQHRAIFGEWKGSVQTQNDPYTLALSADPATAPYLYLSCGDKGGLLPANKRLAGILTKRQFRYEFHVQSGGHNWNQWNANISQWFTVLLQHVS